MAEEDLDFIRCHIWVMNVLIVLLFARTAPRVSDISIYVINQIHDM